jgi:hypothetical protein
VNSRWLRYTREWILPILAVGALLSCEAVDRGMATTEEGDFTLEVQVPDDSFHVGDEVPITVRLRREDKSNLDRGVLGTVIVTSSVHGSVDRSEVQIDVEDDTTKVAVKTLIFVAARPGVAEVRVSFKGATVLVKILISGVTT